LVRTRELCPRARKLAAAVGGQLRDRIGTAGVDEC
jgi:hypothetical protein